MRDSNNQLLKLFLGKDDCQKETKQFIKIMSDTSIDPKVRRERFKRAIKLWHKESLVGVDLGGLYEDNMHRFIPNGMPRDMFIDLAEEIAREESKEQ